MHKYTGIGQRQGASGIFAHLSVRKLGKAGAAQTRHEILGTIIALFRAYCGSAAQTRQESVMNISLNTTNTMSPLLSAWERNAASTESADTAVRRSRGDMVDLVSQNNQARLLDDSEVDDTLAATMSMIGSDPYSALSVHSGLDASRVAALLS